MLVYLNALTWTHDPETLAAEIREALRVGLHLQPCHEFPSVLDPASERAALDFKRIIEATPADLTVWPTNIFSQIAISLKGGELRDVGLANVAARLAKRVPKASNEVKPAASRGRSKSAAGRMPSATTGPTYSDPNVGTVRSSS
eukprot:5229468-Prymnesium_polylepis.1